MRISAICHKLPTYGKSAIKHSKPGFNYGRNQINNSFNRNDNRGPKYKKKWSRSNDSKYNDDSEILGRTKGHQKFDDGLRGQQNYAIDTEAVEKMKWTDLINQEAGAAKPEVQGVSSVATQQLAAKRLLSLPLVNSLIYNRKYEWLTPVQAQTLLPILRNESVVVRAKTGTGKTAAFVIPILQKVLETKQASGSIQGKVHALIVTPTRELAQQIADEVFKITQYGGLNHIKVQSLVGGVSKDRQLRAAGLESETPDNKVSDIIVATPGRLRDVLDDSDVAERFSHLKFRVFDEADRILDIGFEREMEEIKDIINDVSVSKEIPLLLFSATADRTMREFARRQFGDRVRVVDTVPKDEPTANELVEQHAMGCPTWADVYEAACNEIVTSYNKAKEAGTNFKAVVFLPTTLMVDHFESVLKQLFGRRSHFSSLILGIHGNRKQQSRQNRADKFRKEKDAMLITTDVVARGMDFPQVTHVFQLGPPPDVSSYIHRIGRTARIGNSGKSHLYYTRHVRGYIDALNRDNIKPNLSTYTEDAEFRTKLVQAFENSVSGDDEAEDVVRSLMSYMTVLKSKYRVVPQEFIRDMQPYVELMGLEKLNLTGEQRRTWTSSSSYYNKRQGRNQSNGSSRRSRMNWRF